MKTIEQYKDEYALILREQEFLYELKLKYRRNHPDYNRGGAIEMGGTCDITGERRDKLGEQRVNLVKDFVKDHPSIFNSVRFITVRVFWDRDPREEIEERLKEELDVTDTDAFDGMLYVYTTKEKADKVADLLNEYTSKLYPIKREEVEVEELAVPGVAGWPGAKNWIESRGLPEPDITESRRRFLSARVSQAVAIYTEVAKLCNEWGIHLND